MNQTERKFRLTSAEDFETAHPKPADIMNSIKMTETVTGVIITGYHKQEIKIPKVLGNKSYHQEQASRSCTLFLTVCSLLNDFRLLTLRGARVPQKLVKKIKRN